MSSVNAPQPDATGPAEVFDSTASSPHGTTISAIGTPAGPPNETPSHTGMMNQIDTALMMQYVPTDIVTWSVTSISGTLMWKKPIHPMYAHPGISYLSGLYNTWSGALDFNFKIAGTGFHAGAIAIVRIPPNLKPEDFQTPTSWGLFEYVVLDPKTLQVESLGVSDQRPIMYHYMKFDQDNPNTYGGWIAMYTLLPLNTSATGSQQISIQVFNRPGSGFQFSQMVMPGNITQEPPFPDAYSEYFDFSPFDTLTTYPIAMTHLVLEPQDVKFTKAVMNCIQLDGTIMSKFDNQDIPNISTLQFAGGLNGDCHDGNDNFDLKFTKTIQPLGVPKVGTGVSIFRHNGSLGHQYLSTGDSKTTLVHYEQSVVDKTVTIVIQPKSNMAAVGLVSNVFITDVLMPEIYTDNTYAPVTGTESIVHFAYRREPLLEGNVYGAQYRRISELFLTGRLGRLLPKGMCFLFVLVDKTEDLPVAYVKLYKEGIFTTRAGAQQTIFDSKNMRLVFSSYILRSDAIPQNTTYAANRLALGMRK